MRGLKTTTILIAILVLITAWVVMVGCVINVGVIDGTNNQCIAEVPTDYTVTKVEMIPDGSVYPPLKVILVNKHISRRVYEETIKHELCHVTEWQQCLPLGYLSGGWHSLEHKKAWAKMLLTNEYCKEKVNEPDLVRGEKI